MQHPRRVYRAVRLLAEVLADIRFVAEEARELRVWRQQMDQWRIGVDQWRIGVDQWRIGVDQRQGQIEDVLRLLLASEAERRAAAGSLPIVSPRLGPDAGTQA